MEIGVQLYTLREYLKTREEIFSTFQKVKEMGYDVIQVSGIGDITKEKAQDIKEAKDLFGLSICATHVSWNQLIHDLDWLIEVHHLWECRYVGVGMMPADYQERIDAFIEILNSKAQQLKEHGLQLVYHNHAFEFKKWGKDLILDYLFTHFSEHVQFELDTYWIQKGGQSPEHWIEKVSGRMDVVHFKDFGVKNWDESVMEIVGDGNLNWPGIIQVCKKTGVKYACVEQDDTGGRDPFLCLKMSVDYLKRMI